MVDGAKGSGGDGQAAVNQNDLIRALVRIRAHDSGRIVGTGILVSPHHALTCAHVVTEALGFKEDDSNVEAPTRAVLLDLPATAPERVLPAKVVVWHPRKMRPGGIYDIAGLELSDAIPEDATPVPLVDLSDRWNQPCRIFGFPAGRPDGNYAEGILKDVLANGWVMIRGGGDAREFTRPGYSGGPVYTREGIVGMLTEGDRDQRVKEAVMIPTAVLLEAWPDLYRLNSTCPYQGLTSFSEAQARFFRGREGATQRLVEAISAPASLTVLAGASGSGKSSMIFAGVVPTLKTRGLPEHDRQRFGPEASWLVASFRPGDAPFEALAQALLPLVQPELQGTMRLRETQNLGASLREGTLGLPEVVGDILRRQEPNTRLLLVMDQCEELFTQLRPAEPRTESSSPLRLIDQLDSLLEHPTAAGRVSVLLAIRTDYLDGLLEYPPLRKLQHQPGAIQYLGPVDDLREVIEGPLRELGIGRLEEGLAVRILRDLKGEPNPLPLLEFTLTELWHRQLAGRLTHTAYTELGGVSQAVASYAQGVFEALSPQEQRQAQDVFIQLAQPGRDQTVTRRVARNGDFPEDQRALIKRLADSRLIVTGLNEGTPDTVEVIHEALFEHWPLLQGWIRESWIFRSWQEGLRSELRLWLEAGQDPSYLLRGGRLATAEAYLKVYRDRLNQQEQTFIEASAEQQEAQLREEAARRAREARLQRRTNRILSTFMIAALALSGLALWQWHRVRQEQLVTSSLNERLEAANIHLLDALAQAEANARSALATRLSVQGLFLTRDPTAVDDVRLGALLAAQAVRLEENLQSRGNLLRVVQSVPTAPSYTVAEIALSPDGSTLAVASRNEIILWDPAANQRRGGLRMNHPGELDNLTFSPGGLTVAASLSSTIYLWSMNSNAPVAELSGGHDLQVWDLTFSPDGTRLVSTDQDGGLVIWDVATGQTTGRLDRRNLVAEAATPPATLGVITLPRQRQIDPELEHRDLAGSVAFSPDGTHLALAGWNDLVHIFDVGTLQPIRTLSGPPYQARSVQYSQDGSVIAVGSRDGAVHLWAATTFESLGEPLLGLEAPVRTLTFSPDGEVLGAADASGKVALWDLAAWRMLRDVFEVGAETVNHLLLADSTLFILGQVNGRSALWDVPVGEGVLNLDTNLQVTKDHQGYAEVWDMLGTLSLSTPLGGTLEVVAQVSFSPDGRILATRDSRLEMQLWDTLTRKPLGAVLEGYPLGVEAMAFSPDGNVLLTGSHDGQLVARDPRTASPLQEPISAGARILGLAYHPDGKRVAVGMEGKVVIWDTSAWMPLGEVAWDMHMTNDLIKALAFSPDGSLLAGGIGQNLALWDSDTLALVTEPLPGAFGNSKIKHLTFSPNGRLIAAQYENQGVVLWDIETQQRTNLFDAPSAAFHPDELLLAVGDLSGQLNLLDAATLEPLSEPLPGHAHAVELLTVSQDGRLLATASVTEGGTLLLWDISLESWLDYACARAGHNLSGAEWTRYLVDRPYERTCAGYPVDASAVSLLLTQAEAMLPGDSAEARVLLERASRWAVELGEPEILTRVCEVATASGFTDSILPTCQQVLEKEFRYALF